MEKNLVNKYIAEAIRRVLKNHHENYRDVSQRLNMSYNYFRHLVANYKNFMPSKIYEIARIEQIPVTKLFPPIQDTKKGFHNFVEVTGDKSESDFERFLKKTKV